jgi:hypothetical protein
MREKPDVVWLPLDTYQATLDEFLASQEFRSQYRVWTADEVGRELGIGLKIGSSAEKVLTPVVERMVRDRRSP